MFLSGKMLLRLANNSCKLEHTKRQKKMKPTHIHTHTMREKLSIVGGKVPAFIVIVASFHTCAMIFVHDLH